MKLEDVLIIVASAFGAYFLVRLLSAPGAPQLYRVAPPLWQSYEGNARAPGGSRAADYSAPGATRYSPPPSGAVWDETRGAYVIRDGDGLLLGLYA